MNLYPPDFLIAGTYQVASRPLMGGMGIVYLCYDHGENRPVALKTFKPEYLPDRATRERFLREGDTWMRLKRHSNIVHAYNVVRVGDGTEVYLVLELIAKEQGRQDASLRSWLTPGQPLPPEQAMLFAMQVIRGMQHATARIPVFVHRDLKPENLLVGSDKLTNANINRLRVTDLGLASVVADPREIAGTPPYMAPEQWQGEAVNIATDVYALGCIVFEMLAGERAVSGSSLSELEQAHKATQRKALPVNLPIDLRAWVERCLRVAPSDRYANWEEAEAGLADAYWALTGRRLPEEETAGEINRAERVAAGWAQNDLGASYLDIGKADAAQVYFERAIQIGRNEQEKALTGAAFGNLGIAYRNLAGVRRAIEYSEQALAIHREIGDRPGEGADLGNLGLAYAALGEVRRAIEYFEQSLAIHREIGDRRGEGNALSSLGVAYKTLGEVLRAIAYYLQRLEITQEIGDRRGEGITLGNLGEAYRLLGAVQRAIDYHEQALMIDREIGNPQGEGANLASLGTAYAQLGDLQRAIGYYEQALAINREIGYRQGEGAVLGNLGIAYKKLGETQRAIGYYEQNIAVAREIGDRQGEAITCLNMAQLYREQGDISKALPLARQALLLFQSMGHPGAQNAERLVADLQRPAPSGGI